MQQLVMHPGAPAGLAIWLLDLDLSRPVADADWSVLDEAEAARALLFRKAEDRVRFAVTRAALRRLLGERLDVAPRHVTFTLNDNGKPGLSAHLAKGEGMEFNVSHSGDHALIALSVLGVVGVDIERRDASVDIAALASLTLSRRERCIPAACRMDFFDCWAAKEAVLKAIGTGVADHLDRFSVFEPSGTGDRPYRLDYDGADWPPVRAWKLDAPAGYAAAFAHAGGSAPPAGRQPNIVRASGHAFPVQEVIA